MKKFTCLLILLLILCLTACGNTSAPDAEVTTAAATVTETVTETERNYPDVTGLDFEGETYSIIYFGPGPDDGYSDGFYFDLDAESETGDILKDSLYRRNRNVEEKLNMKFSLTETVTTNEFIGSVRKSTLAGSGDYDLLVPILYFYPNLITESLAYNLYNVNGMDLTSEWWDQKSVSELSISNGLWGVVSDFTIADKMSSICIFFSKPMAENFNMDDHYKLVIDGDWTLEKMLANVNLVVSDINGDGEMTLEKDCFGIMCDADFTYEGLHSAGMKIAHKGEDNLPYLSIFDEEKISVMEKIQTIMNEKYFINRKTHKLSMSDMSTIFGQNQVLYFQHIPEALLELRQTTTDFGIIPTPKYTESQENYYTPVTHYAATFTAIPIMAKNPENSAVLITLLAAESYYEVMPSLYNVVLDVKYTRDDESAQMLDIIFNNRFYDIGNICNFGGTGDKVYSLDKSKSIVADLEKVKAKAETELAEFNAAAVEAE